MKLKSAITQFNARLLSKIVVYLSTREGFITEETEYTVSGIKSIVRDVFGYRYEIHVKTLSRLEGHLEPYDKYTEKTIILNLDQVSKA